MVVAVVEMGRFIGGDCRWTPPLGLLLPQTLEVLLLLLFCFGSLFFISCQSRGRPSQLKER